MNSSRNHGLAGTTECEAVLKGVSKRFPNGTEALAPVDIDVAVGDFVSIVGPSGCGKSTLLRILAGLITPSAGVSHRRPGQNSAFVFQDAALLPWRNVHRNVELLMELEGWDRAVRSAAAAQALDLVGLGGFDQAYPHELSGGMRMRLSLARALAVKPDLLLLDEPLAAVDELTRDVLQDELARLWQLSGFAAVLVTHNVYEAVYLSKRVVIMSKRPGRIRRVVDIPFPFPRNAALRSSSEFASLAGDISGTLRQPDSGIANAEI